MADANPRLTTPSVRDFRAALDRCGDRWYTVCLNLTRNPALAEDAVQEGLLTAWRKRHQFRGAARLDTWMHRIIVNAALHQLRRRTGPGLEETGNDAPVDSATPADIALAGEVFHTLNVQLERLTDLERACFVLKHIEEWTLAEIAAELDGSVNSVKQALFRALKKLRVGLADWSNGS